MHKTIEAIIRSFVQDYPSRKGQANKWGVPLVSFARARDERFLKLKDSVSPTHFMPWDLLPDAESVIVYFIPFLRPVGDSNRQEQMASRDWAETYIETNELIKGINLLLQQGLEKRGYRTAVIPATHNFDETTLMSDWSHRHVALIAGLGGLGLNNMLITKRGCCGRLGSIITDLPIDPLPVKEEHFCLFFKSGACGQCVKQCPSQALTYEGFDRHRCYEVCLENAKFHVELGLADVCGKCTVGLPCSFGNPLKNGVSA
jgi:epoxyqueuosine reductase QueG